MFQDCLEGTVLLIKLDVIAVSGGMFLLLAPAGKSDSISKIGCDYIVYLANVSIQCAFYIYLLAYSATIQIP